MDEPVGVAVIVRVSVVVRGSVFVSVGTGVRMRVRQFPPVPV